MKKLASFWLLGIITLFLLLDLSVKYVDPEDFLTEFSIDEITQIGGSNMLLFSELFMGKWDIYLSFSFIPLS